MTRGFTLLRAFVTLLTTLAALAVPGCLYAATWGADEYEGEFLATAFVTVLCAMGLVILTGVLWARDE